MAAQQEKPLNELLSRDMVDIYVGSENTHWVLHEKLLCYRSKFFRNIFYNKESKNKVFGLPDEDDEPFKLFVGWLYSASVPSPKEEKDLTYLFDLYLMGEKLQIRNLVIDVLDSVRTFYHENETYPGLRRIQYIYANTEADSPMRQLLIECIARFLILGDGIPPHWDKALRKNGQLAVDIILAVQKWRIEAERVPDAREESVVPLLEDAEHARGYKIEESDDINPEESQANVKQEPTDDDEEMPNGVDHEMTNGDGGSDNENENENEKENEGEE